MWQVQVVTIDNGITPERLFAIAQSGEQIQAPQVGVMVPALLQRIAHPKTGELVFAMWGTTGRHCLNVSCTDAARLHAHWQGFKEVATAACPGAPARAPGPVWARR